MIGFLCLDVISLKVLKSQFSNSKSQCFAKPWTLRFGISPSIKYHKVNTELKRYYYPPWDLELEIWNFPIY